MAGVFFQNGYDPNLSNPVDSSLSPFTCALVGSVSAGDPHSGIIISKRFFDAVRRLDSWGIAFIVSVIFWAIAVLIALYLLITIGLWYRRQGGSRPKTTVPQKPSLKTATRGNELG